MLVCDGTHVNDIFYKNTYTWNGRETFTGQTSYGTRHLYYFASTERWGFSPDMGGSLLNPRRWEDSQMVPTAKDWGSTCNNIYFNREVYLTRSNCYDCGQNKITTASSNACMCRTGQSPGGGGVCANCPGNTYKNGHSDAACSSCVAHSTSPEGSTSIEACLCVAGRTKTGGSCVSCQRGTYKAGNSDAACSACPADSDSPEGSSASSACVCNTGYIGQSGSACSVCQAGKYKSSSTLCTDCTAHSFSPAASDGVGLCVCNTGYTGQSGGACSVCVSGKYKSSSTLCTDCTAYSDSPEGSNGVESCVCNTGYIGETGGACSV